MKPTRRDVILSAVLTAAWTLGVWQASYRWHVEDVRDLAMSSIGYRWQTCEVCDDQHRCHYAQVYIPLEDWTDD